MRSCKGLQCLYPACTVYSLPACLSKVLKYDSKEAYEESMAAIEEVAEEMERHFETKRATGTTPRAIQRHDSGSSIRDAFKL